MYKKLIRFLILPPFILLLIISIWGGYWIYDSFDSYYRRLEVQADEIARMKESQFITYILTNQEEALKEEMSLLKSVFASVENVSFFPRKSLPILGPISRKHGKR